MKKKLIVIINFVIILQLQNLPIVTLITELIA